MSTDGSSEIKQTSEKPKSRPEQAQNPNSKNAENPLAKIPYDTIGKALRLNETKPPKPEAFFPTTVGNMFAEADHPTLAGKVIASLYDQLTERPGYVQPKILQETQDLIAQDKQSRERFANYVRTQLKAREEKSDKPIGLSAGHETGKDDFHFNNSGNTTQDHALYFSKSHEHWKNSAQQEVRAYITLSPQERDLIQEYFVDLSISLYDSGIDFSAKSSGAVGLARRTDNMVFYIAAPDQAHASEIIKKYMTEREIGQGHILAAIPSPQEGLSWAMEPTESQNKIWQEVSGSTAEASFNTLVATYAIPTYLDRLASAHIRAGDENSARSFQQEAERVRRIIYRPKTVQG